MDFDNLAAYEIVAIPIWVYDFDRRRISWANDAARGLWGVETVDEIRSCDLVEHHSSDLLPGLETIRQALITESNVEKQLTLYPKNKPVTLDCRITRYEMSHGRIVSLWQGVPIGIDDSTSPHCLAALNNTTVMITLYSDKEEIIYDNPMAQRSRVSKLETLRERFLDDSEYELFIGVLKKHQSTNIISRVTTASGPRWHEVNASISKDPHSGGHIYVLSEVDVTQRIEAEGQVRYLAHHDSLTGLPNRAYFELEFNRYLEQEGAHGPAEGALFFIDLNNFKKVNDTMGHLAGDELLAEFGRQLGRIAKEYGFVARLGGDEFVLLFNLSSDQKIIEEVALDIIQQLSSAIQIRSQDRKVNISLSIGIALYPKHGNQMKDIMRCADLAMYRAKVDKSRSYAVYNSARKYDTHESINIEKKIKTAIENGEFVLFYQPRYRVRGQRLIGAEALLRWRNQEGRVFLPYGFMRDAEDSNLLALIDKSVLDTALQEFSGLKTQDSLLRLSLNISSYYMKDPTFMDQFTGFLAKSNLAPEHVEFELSDIAWQDENSVIQNNRQTLADLGCNFVLKNYHVSTRPLTNIHRIKIPGSYLCDDRNESKIKNICRQCQLAGVAISANQIEFADQYRKATELQLDEYQGNYFSPPVPIEMFKCIVSANDQGTG